MLVMSKGALSVGQAETYYQEKYSEDDYYTESHRVAGEWSGKAAEILGLSGTISEEDFRAILRGMRPGGGEVLVSAAAGRDERRAGWDATFNAPKSVSIQALVGEDARLVERRIGMRSSSHSRNLKSSPKRATTADRSGLPPVTSLRPASSTSPRGHRRPVLKMATAPTLTSTPTS
jgi:TrwC relaxase